MVRVLRRRRCVERARSTPLFASLGTRLRVVARSSAAGEPAVGLGDLVVGGEGVVAGDVPAAVGAFDEGADATSTPGH